MRLTHLLDGKAHVEIMPQDVDIQGLTADSREVAPGFLFAALPGVQMDGASFIGEALERGASAILAAPEVDLTAHGWRDSAQAAVIRDMNPRQRFSLMAATFYGAQPDVVAAVTGTNGKTSIASFVRQIWTLMGLEAASLGTLGVVQRRDREALQHTTPDPVKIHRVLKELKDRKIDHLALEASSHGLAQYRLDGVRIKAAAFTNLTQDHLDYHASLEEYFFTKMRLFAEVLPPSGIAVLNADSPVYEEVEAVCWARGQRVIAVGESAPARGGHIRLEARTPTGQGQEVRVRWKGRSYDIRLPLVGAFQASNALIAAGLVIACGGVSKRVFPLLEKLETVPGRLQMVGATSDGAPIFVDYAHTPDALATVLQAVRPHCTARLHVVFGAGGDRDQTKRPLMGKAARAGADVVTVTDDNPRREDPAAIRREIMVAAPGAQEIGDRGEAIEHAIAALGPGDLLVVAGKGHETGQIVGDDIIPFNDADEIRRILLAAGGRHER